MRRPFPRNNIGWLANHDAQLAPFSSGEAGGKNLYLISATVSVTSVKRRKG